MLVPIIYSNLSIDVLDPTYKWDDKLKLVKPRTVCYALQAPPICQELYTGNTHLDDGSNLYEDFGATSHGLALDGTSFGFVRAGSKTDLDKRIRDNQKIQCHMLGKVEENLGDGDKIGSVTWKFYWGTLRSWESIAREKLEEKTNDETRCLLRQKGSVGSLSQLPFLTSTSLDI